MIHLLHLKKLWCNAAVRSDNTVAAEVLVVWLVAEATAVIEAVFGFAWHIQALVNPVPDATANHALAVIFDIIPIFLKITDRVAHSVGIFTHDIRLLIAVLVHAYHTFDRRIHVRIDVGNLVLSLVVDRTAVEGAHCIAFGNDIAARSRCQATR